jgi:hypothetical protein
MYDKFSGYLSVVCNADRDQVVAFYSHPFVIFRELGCKRVSLFTILIEKSHF